MDARQTSITKASTYMTENGEALRLQTGSLGTLLRSRLTPLQAVWCGHMAMTISAVIAPMLCGSMDMPCQRYVGQSVAAFFAQFPMLFAELFLGSIRVGSDKLDALIVVAPILLAINSLIAAYVGLLLLRSGRWIVVTFILKRESASGPLGDRENGKGRQKIRLSERFTKWSFLFSTLLLAQLYVASYSLLDVSRLTLFGMTAIPIALYPMLLVVPTFASHVLRNVYESRIAVYGVGMWTSWTKIAWISGIVLVAWRIPFLMILGR